MVIVQTEASDVATMIGIEGNSQAQLTLLREVTAWQVIAKTQRELLSGEVPSHAAEDIYRARAALGDIRGITEGQAWKLVRETTHRASADRRQFLDAGRHKEA